MRLNEQLAGIAEDVAGLGLALERAERETEYLEARASAIGEVSSAGLVAVSGAAADPMAFLTEVTVPFIFGSIIVLNMLGNSLFARMTQPLKGVMNTIAAAAVGLVLAHLYVSLVPMVTGPLPSGPPGYEREVWLANALLSVTFPFLIYYAVFFGFWPLVRTSSEKPVAKV